VSARPCFGSATDVRAAHATALSTLKLCRRAAGATGGFVRQCEAVGTGRLAARGTQESMPETLRLFWPTFHAQNGMDRPMPETLRLFRPTFFLSSFKCKPL
jgi:hypothetical protein